MLRADEHALLAALVQKHLAKHGNDAEKSLAAVSSVGSVRQELQRRTANRPASEPAPVTEATWLASAKKVEERLQATNKRRAADGNNR